MLLNYVVNGDVAMYSAFLQKSFLSFLAGV